MTNAKDVLVNLIGEKYQIDLTAVDHSTPLVELASLNTNLDSIGFLNLMFDVEDKLNINLGDFEYREMNLGQLYAHIQSVVDAKK